jgi:hypothetical protein
VDEATAEDALTAIEEALTAWWDKRSIVAELQKAARHKVSEGRGPLYALIPPGLRDENGMIPRCATLAEALRYIYVDARHPNVAGITTDEATRMELGVVLGVDSDGQATADISYLDDEQRAVLEILPRADGAEPWVLDLAGYLFVHDSPVEPPIVNRQTVQIQKSITMALSQMMRNVNVAGHREKTYVNAKPPGEWTIVPEGTPGAIEQSNGAWAVFVPAPIVTGPGAVNFIQGNEVYNQDGQLIAVTNPNVSTVEPSPVEHFVSTYQTLRAVALQGCHQAHVLGTAAAQSGISREQARADFEMSLGPLKTAMDDAGRWLITVVLRMAAELMGQPRMFDNLRVEFDCIIDTGPLTPEEQQQVRENAAAKLISRERGMSLLGVEDVGAEAQRIEDEATNDQTRESTNASAILTRAGLLAQEARTLVPTPEPELQEA